MDDCNLVVLVLETRSSAHQTTVSVSALCCLFIHVFTASTLCKTTSVGTVHVLPRMPRCPSVEEHFCIKVQPPALQQTGLFFVLQPLWDWIFFWRKVPKEIPLEPSRFRLLNPRIIKETALDLLKYPQPRQRLWGWDQVT